MSLQLTKTSLAGVTINNAIHKVSSAVLHENGDVGFSVQMKIDDVAEHPVETTYHSFQHDKNGGNLLTQCYSHLLTLPEYAGATTV